MAAKPDCQLCSGKGEMLGKPHNEWEPCPLCCPEIDMMTYESKRRRHVVERKSYTYDRDMKHATIWGIIAGVVILILIAILSYHIS